MPLLLLIDPLLSASFLGTRIILRQVSPESEDIFDFIIALHNACDGNWSTLQTATETSSQDLQYFLEYATQFLYNAGNYKGFGDSKFVPRLSPEAMERLASTTPKAKELLSKIGGKMFVEERDLLLGWPATGGISNYYPDSPDIKQEEVEALDEILTARGLLPENTRVKKLPNGDFEVHIASGVQHPPATDVDISGPLEFGLEGKLSGKKARIVYGDYQEVMAKIAVEMKKAGEYAASPKQKEMMDAYAKSFATGSLQAFKESQRLWVADLGTACLLQWLRSADVVRADGGE